MVSGGGVFVSSDDGDGAATAAMAGNAFSSVRSTGFCVFLSRRLKRMLVFGAAVPVVRSCVLWLENDVKLLMWLY